MIDFAISLSETAVPTPQATQHRIPQPEDTLMGYVEAEPQRTPQERLDALEIERATDGALTVCLLATHHNPTRLREIWVRMQ